MAGRRKRGEPPPYLLHAATGQAYSTVNGKPTYFGPHGTEESRYRYQRFLRNWERTHGRTIVAEAGPDDGSIRAAVDAYLAEIRGNLSPGEYVDTKRNLDRLAGKYGQLEPDDFRPTDYKRLRTDWVHAGLHRRTIVKACGHVKRFFRWCVSERRAAPETHAMLLAVLPLARDAAPVNPPIEPVPPRDFGLTCRHLGRHVKAMVLLQFLCGPRPGEICRMRGCEVIRTGTVRIGNRTLKIPKGVWLFMPEQHKKKAAGKQAVYVLGPRAQRIVEPFLARDAGEFLFDPAEARREWEALKRAQRRTKVQPSQADRSKRRPLLLPGKCYSVSSYGRAIERACDRAGVPHWNPHAVRHNFVTRMDSAADLVISSTAVGHEQLQTTLIYLQRKILDVAAFASKIG